jgi:hypothetical protein
MRAVSKFSLLLFLFCGLLSNSLNAQEATPENLMATFIYNFTNYIEWEKPGPDSIFRIAIFGKDKLSKPLHYIASIKKVDQKTIQVIEAENQSELDQSDIIYVSGDHTEMIALFNQQFPEHKSLIISASGVGLENGAMINFINQNGKIGFEINQTAIKNHGLKVSSRLLKIAVKVI